MKRICGLQAICLATSLATLGGILAPRPADAQTPAVGFLPGALGVEDNAADTSVSGYSLGFEFTANAPQLVSALGFFSDPSFNPATPFGSVTLNPAPTGSRAFAQDHAVGLYQVVGGVSTLLASATVTSAGVKNGAFLYQSLLTPVLLVTGGDYVLAGVTGPTDPYVFDIQDSQGNAALTTNGITYVQDRYAVSSTLTPPTQTDANAPFPSTPGFFGPNFLSAPVPEASTTLSLGLLLALGLAGLAASRRTRKAGPR